MLPVVYCHIFLASDLCRLDVAKRVGLIEHFFANKQNNPDPLLARELSCQTIHFSSLAFGIQLDWILTMVTDFATDKNVGRYAGEDDEEDFPLQF